MVKVEACVPLLNVLKDSVGRVKRVKREEIEDALRDYHWMIREISRLRGYLEDAGEGTVRQYGIDSGMPKPQGGNTDPVYQETARRERKWKRLEKLENKVLYIQDHLYLILDEREKTVLDCMLDGMSYRSIARHMGLSHSHIQRIKDSIVSNLDDVPNVPKGTKLKIGKLCV
jgi:DNA-directed RNA polymerase specialized sigma24 family protein